MPLMFLITVSSKQLHCIPPIPLAAAANTELGPRHGAETTLTLPRHARHCTSDFAASTARVALVSTCPRNPGHGDSTLCHLDVARVLAQAEMAHQGAWRKTLVKAMGPVTIPTSYLFFLPSPVPSSRAILDLA